MNETDDEPPQFTSPYQRRYLLGPPVSRAKQRRLGIIKIIPTLGSQKEVCCVCKKHLWVGPDALKYWCEHICEDGIEFKCLECARVDIADSDINTFNGRSHEYFFKDGTCAGPFTQSN
jgi:hypothetical protein